MNTTDKHIGFNADADNTPSKIRGGGAQATGALNTPPSSQEHSPVMNIPELKDIRRHLRTHGTSAEGALWNMLKGKQIAGLQFRRQFSVGHHILDFYCPALKVAIELDGDYHYHMEMPTKDYERDEELLREHGIKTLRFENKIVFNHPESIVFAIMQEVDASRRL